MARDPTAAVETAKWWLNEVRRLPTLGVWRDFEGGMRRHRLTPESVGLTSAEFDSLRHDIRRQHVFRQFTRARRYHAPENRWILSIVIERVICHMHDWRLSHADIGTTPQEIEKLARDCGLDPASPQPVRI